MFNIFPIVLLCLSKSIIKLDSRFIYIYSYLQVDRLRSGVDSYRRTQRCDDYSRSNRTRVMDYDLRGDYPQLDPPLEDLPDRLKRERRTDLARQQAGM